MNACGVLACDILTPCNLFIVCPHTGDLGKTFLWRYLLFFFQEGVFWIMNIDTMFSASDGFSRSLIKVSSNDTKVIALV